VDSVRALWDLNDYKLCISTIVCFLYVYYTVTFDENKLDYTDTSKAKGLGFSEGDL
jgi:hypothetical protein